MIHKTIGGDRNGGPHCGIPAGMPGAWREATSAGPPGSGELVRDARHAKRRIIRRWCVPPAIMRSPNETVDGSGILAELSDALGLLLWRTARDVTLWSGTPPPQRGYLFADGSVEVRITHLLAAELPPSISAAVDTIHGMLTLGTRADPVVLSLCCLEIASWAFKCGLSETAIAFAQAGAVAAPEFGEAALSTGIYALRAGQIARAATWLRRAVAVSRRERDRPAYCAALVELGELYEHRGKLVWAQSRFRMAFRAGRRFSSRSARMRAAHGLFRLARTRGDAASAAQFALAAQRAYEPDVVGGLKLLVDLARFWTDLGQRRRARVALRRLAPFRTLLSPAESLAAAAMAARAFAMRGRRKRSEDRVVSWMCARKAWRALEEVGTISDEVRLAAAMDLAHAARINGDALAFARAKRYALRLAPRDEFFSVANEIAEMWPQGGVVRSEATCVPPPARSANSPTPRGRADGLKQFRES